MPYCEGCISFLTHLQKHILERFPISTITFTTTSTLRYPKVGSEGSNHTAVPEISRQSKSKNLHHQRQVFGPVGCVSQIKSLSSHKQRHIKRLGWNHWRSKNLRQLDDSEKLLVVCFLFYLQANRFPTHHVAKVLFFLRTGGHWSVWCFPEKTDGGRC